MKPNTDNQLFSNNEGHDQHTGSSDRLKEDAQLVLEIRNPLTTIALSIEMIRTGLDEEDITPYTEIIERGLQRIHQLVDVLVERQELSADAL